jgi:hypothetical protein
MMDESDFLKVLKPYYEAFAEKDADRRFELLGAAMSPDAEIWGPGRVFAGYEQISEKIDGFQGSWPGCRLVLATGLNVFLNATRIGGAIIGPDGTVQASGEAFIELSEDGRIRRVIPFWDPLPPLPPAWPKSLASD